jgi:hypothetical protein
MSRGKYKVSQVPRPSIRAGFRALKGGLLNLESCISWAYRSSTQVTDCIV